MFNSKFKMLSIGIVAEDRKLNDNVVKVYPIELLPVFDGELVPTETQLESTGEDLNGDLYSVNINVCNYIEAQWLSENGNRLSPPDVVRGEQVILWHYADSHEYYWTSMGRDTNLRKLETVTYAFSDIPDNGGDEPKGRDNQYIAEVSTHGKHVTIKTCKRDGEEFAYTLQVNAGEGCYLIEDDVGNIIYLDSKNTEIRLENSDLTNISLNQKDISIYAPHDIDIKADNDISIEARNDIRVIADGEISVWSGGKMDLSTGSSMSMVSASDYSVVSGSTLSLSSDSSMSLDSSDSIDVDSGAAMSLSSGATTSITAPASVSVTAPSIGLNGSVSIGGGLRDGNRHNLMVSGNLNVNGEATVSSNLSVNSSLTVSNSIDANAVEAETIEASSMKASRFDGNFYGTLYGSVVP